MMASAVSIFRLKFDTISLGSHQQSDFKVLKKMNRIELLQSDHRRDMKMLVFLTRVRECSCSQLLKSSNNGVKSVLNNLWLTLTTNLYLW